VSRPPSRRPVRLDAPTGLRAATLSLEGEELVVLSFPTAPPALPAGLTPAEREVATFLLEGRSSTEIAAARGTAVRTVVNQIASIYRRTGARSRAELAARCARG